MGSSSRSNSSQASSNISTSFGIQGDNQGQVINGSGNTVTDGGAFDVVGRLVDILPYFGDMGVTMVSDAFSSVGDVAMMGERQNENFLNAAVDLFGESSTAQRDMMRLSADTMTEAGEIMSNNSRDAFDFAGGVVGQAIGSVSDTADFAINANRAVTQDAIAGNKDLAVTVADALAGANDNNTALSKMAMDNSAYISANALESVNQANNDAFKQLSGGFDSILNWANDFSRSDGADLADKNNKTILYIVGGLALTGVATAVILRGSK